MSGQVRELVAAVRAAEAERDRARAVVAAVRALVDAQPHPLPLNDEWADAWDALRTALALHDEQEPGT